MADDDFVKIKTNRLETYMAKEKFGWHQEKSTANAQHLFRSQIRCYHLRIDRKTKGRNVEVDVGDCRHLAVKRYCCDETTEARNWRSGNVDN